MTHARILLKADHADAGPGWTDVAIAGALEVNLSTVRHVRRQVVQAGLAAALARKRPDRTYPHRVDGDVEAQVIAVASTTSSWTSALEPPVAGRRTGPAGGGGGDLPRNGAPDAEKNVVKPWRVKQWCLAPTADPAFVSHLEDVLDVYHRPSRAVQPVICLDETSRQLPGETRPGSPVAPGVAARHDPEYARGGIA